MSNFAANVHCKKFCFILFKARDQQVRVCGRITVGRFPSLKGDLDLCSNITNSLQVNSSSEGEDGSVSGGLYVPYPEEGLWVLAMGLQCYNTTSGR